MEIDGPTDERVSYTPVWTTHVTNPRDGSQDSHVKAHQTNRPALQIDEKQVHRQKPTDQRERQQVDTTSEQNPRRQVIQTIWYINLAVEKHRWDQSHCASKPQTHQVTNQDSQLEASVCIRSYRKHKTTLSDAYRKTSSPMQQLINQRWKQWATHRKTSVFPLPHATDVF